MDLYQYADRMERMVSFVLVDICHLSQFRVCNRMKHDLEGVGAIWSSNESFGVVCIMEGILLILL